MVSSENMFEQDLFKLKVIFEIVIFENIAICFSLAPYQSWEKSLLRAKELHSLRETLDLPKFLALDNEGQLINI